jgi:uncharacterized protein (DUF1800 family)
LGVLVALCMLRAGFALALDIDEARHLLLRTGFGATPAQIAALAPVDHDKAVRRILDGMRTGAMTPPPAFLAAPRPDWRAHYKSTDDEQKNLFNRARDAEAAELKAWWFAEMIATPSPFTERMVLFWHNHFTSSMDKVRQPDLLFRQNALFRRHAAGSFCDLLHEIARDPAMLRYLDSVANKKNGPNENFARELLELFTLGTGHYSEGDIREAARAFTGWHLNDETGEFRFNAREHDDGAKTVLGVTGNLDGGDVIDIVLRQPQTARFIVAKLWREFVAESADEGEIERLAALFRGSDYSIKALLQAMFAAPAFRDPALRGRLVKSPVEILVGTVRSFAVPVADTRPLVDYARRMREDIFNPPNVRGWPGGVAWISTHTLLERREAASRLLNGVNLVSAGGGNMMAGGMMAPAGAASGAAIGPAGLDDWMKTAAGLPRTTAEVARLLLATAPVSPPAADGDIRAAIEHVVLDPAYQLK